MADMLTVTVGTTDYTFDWVSQEIHIENLVDEVTAPDLKDAIHDAQDAVVGMPFDPIADFFNPVELIPGSTSTFLNVVLRDQWRVDSLSVTGTLTIGGGNVVNVNNGIDIFTPNVLVNMVNNTSQAGVLVQSIAASQAIRDAMQLEATDGEASVDTKLNNNFAVSAR
jgi:hypothetical protein